METGRADPAGRSPRPPQIQAGTSRTHPAPPSHDRATPPTSRALPGSPVPVGPETSLPVNPFRSSSHSPELKTKNKVCHREAPKSVTVKPPSLSPRSSHERRPPSRRDASQTTLASHSASAGRQLVGVFAKDFGDSPHVLKGGRVAVSLLNLREISGAHAHQLCELPQADPFRLPLRADQRAEPFLRPRGHRLSHSRQGVGRVTSVPVPPHPAAPGPRGSASTRPGGRSHSQFPR